MSSVKIFNYLDIFVIYIYMSTVLHRIVLMFRKIRGFERFNRFFIFSTAEKHVLNKRYQMRYQMKHIKRWDQTSRIFKGF
jgi:hypothetical protein